MTLKSSRASLARERWHESRVQWVASLPSLIHCSAVPRWLLKVDHGPVRPSRGRDDEADPGEQFAEVVLDLGDHSPGQAPGRGLIREAPVADQRGMARSSGAIDNARIAGVR